MRAVQERVPSHSSTIPDRIVFHRPVGRAVEEFQAIACSTEDGITMPGGPRDVSASDPAWCPNCRALPNT